MKKNIKILFDLFYNIIFCVLEWLIINIHLNPSVIIFMYPVDIKNIFYKIVLLPKPHASMKSLKNKTTYVHQL